MPNYYNQYPYPTGYYQPQQPQQQTVPQIQNGGFISVRNESEARSYPVAHGNSVTFKDETAPYVYTKTMGSSQLDRPIFEKFRLVKEEVAEASEMPQKENNAPQVDISTINELKGEIEAIWSEIEGIKNDRNKSDVPAKRSTKREKDVDD